MIFNWSLSWCYPPFFLLFRKTLDFANSTAIERLLTKADLHYIVLKLLVRIDIYVFTALVPRFLSGFQDDIWEGGVFIYFNNNGFMMVICLAQNCFLQL